MNKINDLNSCLLYFTASKWHKVLYFPKWNGQSTEKSLICCKNIVNVHPPHSFYNGENQITTIIDAFTRPVFPCLCTPMSLLNHIVIISFRWRDERALGSSETVIDTDCDYIECNALGSEKIM